MNGYAPLKRRIFRAQKSQSILFKKLSGKKQLVPLDEFIGLHNIPFKITPGMMLNITQQAIISNSYEEAEKAFKRKHIDIDADTIREVTDFVAEVYCRQEEKDNLLAMESLQLDKSIPDAIKYTREEAGILCIMVDGSYSPLVGKKEIDWRDTKLAVLFNVLDCAHMGKKNIYARDYACCVGSLDEFKPYVASLLKRNDAYFYKEIICVSDGALWIPKLINELIGPHQNILDIYHFKEKAAGYFNQIYDDPVLIARWTKVSHRLIEKGKWQKLQNLKNVVKNKDQKTTGGFINLYTYIDHHKSLIDYPDYFLKEYITASSIIESSNKKVIQERCKGAGKRWSKKRIQGVVSLRCRYFSGQWSEVEKALFAYCFSDLPDQSLASFDKNVNSQKYFST